MSLYRHVGSFAQPTSTGNHSITGLSFQPKLILFFLSERTADGSAANSIRAMGAVDSAGNQASSYGGFKNGATGNSNWMYHYSSACISFVDVTQATVTVQYQDAFVSMDANGFTLNCTTTDGTQRIVNFIALGGSDLTNAKVGFFTEAVATGNQAITGVGFQPDCVLFFTDQSNTGVPSTARSNGNANGIPRPRFGWAKSSSARGVIAGQDHYSGSSIVKSYQRSDRVFIRQASTTGAIAAEADLVSMDSDGFTLTWATVSAAAYLFYVALKGIQVAVGSFNQPTSNGTQSVTGLSFQPVAVLLQSANQAGSASQLAHVRWSIGAAARPTQRFCTWKGGTDAVSPTVDSQNLDRAAVMKMMTENGSTPTTQAVADFSAFITNGFSLSWTTTDATAREILYLAFGPKVADRQRGNMFVGG